MRYKISLISLLVFIMQTPSLEASRSIDEEIEKLLAQTVSEAMRGPQEPSAGAAELGNEDVVNVVASTEAVEQGTKVSTKAPVRKTKRLKALLPKSSS